MRCSVLSTVTLHHLPPDECGRQEVLRRDGYLTDEARTPGPGVPSVREACARVARRKMQATLLYRLRSIATIEGSSITGSGEVAAGYT